MPIDTDSDEWKNGAKIDFIEVEIDNILVKGSEKAFTASEITERLVEEKPHVFPKKLLSSSEHAEWARLALVTSRLEKKILHEQIDMRSVDGELYYSHTSGGHYPIADLVDRLPGELDNLENKIEEETEDLEERLRRLEHRFHEEFDHF